MEGGEEDGDLYNFHSSLTAPMKVLCVISVGRERVDMDRLCRGASPRLSRTSDREPLSPDPKSPYLLRLT